MGMTWDEIRPLLQRDTPPFPEAAAREVAAHPEQFADYLLAELERVADGGALYLFDGQVSAWREGAEYNMLNVYAYGFLAQWRDERALEPLLRQATADEERAEEIFGDDQGSRLGQVLASVCGGDDAPLRALAENTEASLWSRYAAVHAMAVRVVEGDADRNAVLAYLLDLARREAAALDARGFDFGKLPEGFFGPIVKDVPDRDFFLTWVVECLSTIGPVEAMPEIRACFAARLIDPMVSGLDYLERKALLPVGDILAEGRRRNVCYVRDVVRDMRTWACFKEETPLPPVRPPLAEPPLSWPETVRREYPKVGRNDPCPCGSGKKYKKCCGAGI